MRVMKPRDEVMRWSWTEYRCVNNRVLDERCALDGVGVDHTRRPAPFAS